MYKSYQIDIEINYTYIITIYIKIDRKSGLQDLKRRVKITVEFPGS